MIYPSLLIHASPESDWLRTAGIMFVLQNMLVIPLTAPVFAVDIQGAPLAGIIQELKSKIGDLEKNHDASPELVVLKQELKEKISEMRLLYQNGFIIMLGVSLPIGVTLLFSEQILALLTHDKVVAELGGHFLRLITPGIFPTLHGLLSEQILASSHYTKGLKLAPVALATGVVLAWMMGFGYGFPQLKTTGIAIGYNVDSYLNGGILAYFIYKHSTFKDFHFMQAALDVLSLNGGNKAKLLNLLEIGFYIFATISSELILSTAMAAMIERIGIKEARVNTLVSQYMLAQLAVVVNFAVASMIILGRVLGAKRNRDVYLTCRNGLLTVIAASSIIPSFFTLFPRILMMMAGEEDTGMSVLLGHYTKLMLIASVADAARFMALFDLRIMGDSRASALICCLSQFLGIPFAAFLAFYLEMGMVGVGIAYATVIWGGAAALLFRLHHFMKPYFETYQQHVKASPVETLPSAVVRVTDSSQGFFNRGLGGVNSGLSSVPHL